MQKKVVEFTNLLRKAGVRVSTAEALDAFVALGYPTSARDGYLNALAVLPRPESADAAQARQRRAELIGELGNLLVAGRCISVDHRVHHATKEIPACMATGEAAGIAAAGNGTRPERPKRNAMRQR